jgi:threonylcarbamoyladenosine tRNA methylthiotransferase MtaB
MPQVPGQIVKQRAAELRAKGHAVLASYLSEQNGRVFDVLIESDGKGRTPQFAEVEMRGERINTAGEVVRTHITGVGSMRLVGEVCA